MPQRLGNVTIPEPFHFASSMMTRATRLHSEAKEDKYVFRAKPVPKRVMEVGLFDKLMQSKEDRKAELRRQSMAITLAKERPFSFYNR